MSAAAGIDRLGSTQKWRTSSASESNLKPADWETYRKTIEDFYIVKEWSLEKVRREMERSYGFKATKRMFKTRLSSWGLSKNISKQDWQYVGLLLRGRREAGKVDSSILIHKKLRSVKDYEKYLKDNETTDADFLVQAPISAQTTVPHYIRCFTPDSSTSEASRDANSLHMSRDDPEILVLRKHQSNSSYSSTSNPTSGTSMSFIQVASNQTTMQLPSQPNGQPATDHAETNIEDREDHLSRSAPSALHQRPCDSLQQDMRTMIAQVICPERLQSFAPDIGDLQAWFYFSRCPGSGFLEEICSKCGNDISKHDPVPQDFLSDPATETPNKYQSLDLGSEMNDCSAFMAACMSACFNGVKEEYDVLSMCLLRGSVIFKQMLVRNDPLALLAVNTTLITLHAHEQGKMVESIIKSVLRVSLGVLGPENPITLSLEWMTAIAGQRQKTCSVQTPMLRDVYSSFQRSHGWKHQHTIIALYNLGFSLIIDKSYEEAEFHLRNMVELSTETLGASSLQTVAACSTLSRAQARQGNYALAVETLKKGLQYHPLGKNHPFRLESMRRHAFLLKKLGRVAEEERLRFAVLRGRIATLGPKHPNTLSAHTDLIDLLKELGRWEEVKKEVEDAFEAPPPRPAHMTLDEDMWRRVVVENKRW